MFDRRDKTVENSVNDNMVEETYLLMLEYIKN